MRVQLDQAEKLEELVEDMRFVAESDARLLHHRVTGE
jgi:hypothetical protein